ncbi:MAG: hypothetical protein AAFU79_32185 [Myxococcota bacterium]
MRRFGHVSQQSEEELGLKTGEETPTIEEVEGFLAVVSSSVIPSDLMERLDIVERLAQHQHAVRLRRGEFRTETPEGLARWWGLADRLSAQVNRHMQTPKDFLGEEAQNDE